MSESDTNVPTSPRLQTGRVSPRKRFMINRSLEEPLPKHACGGKRERPFFTVVICAYNCEEFLGRAIESLSRQSERNFEAIVVDDGSTDNARHVYERHAKNRDWIRYVRHPRNLGLTAARNTGVCHANGRFITFLDSDDEYLRNHLLERKKAIEQEPRIEFLHGGLIVVGDPCVPDKHDTGKRIDVRQCAVGGTFFIKSDVFDRLGYFKNIPYGEDSDFFERVRDGNFFIKRIAAPTYVYYRTRPNQITNQVVRQQVKRTG